jgi:hypothetical protein
VTVLASSPPHRHTLWCHKSMIFSIRVPCVATTGSSTNTSWDQSCGVLGRSEPGPTQGNQLQNYTQHRPKPWYHRSFQICRSFVRSVSNGHGTSQQRASHPENGDVGKSGAGSEMHKEDRSAAQQVGCRQVFHPQHCTHSKTNKLIRPRVTQSPPLRKQ